MADLLTVYDDEESNAFIDCTVCDRRIRGETSYKIHLTTLQHQKRERALADKGIIPKPVPLPQWTSIKEYLIYLNLNEPIIGLSDLVQEEDFRSNDGRTLLQYRCRLCAVTMDLCEMATHVVGRRHRQKYMERHRPDLVTWEKSSEKQAGAISRAKAAIVEKQDGWGNPVPLIRSIRSDKGRPLRNREQDRSSNLRGRDFSGQDRREQTFNNQSYMRADSYKRPSQYNNNQRNQSYRNAPQNSSRSADNRYGSAYSQGGSQSRSSQDRNYVERPYWEDETNVRNFPQDGAHDERYTDKSDSQPYDDWYPETNTSRGQYKRRQEDNDYRDNSRFDESGMDYRESGRMQAPMYTSQHGPGNSMDERQRQGRNVPYSDKGRDRFKDVDETGTHGSFEMQSYNQRDGYYPTEDDIPVKKKSRFSDASPIDMVGAQNSQIDSMMSKYRERGGTVPTMNQPSGSSMDSPVTPRMENVLDVLSDIQIENVQEATFLKDKLCTLLKQFQSNKAHRAQTSTDVTDSYHGGNKMEPRRDMLDLRHLDDQDYQESARYDHDLQGPRDYLHTRHVEEDPARYDHDLQAPREYLHTRHVEEDPQSMRQNRGPEVPEYQWDSYREGSAGRSEERVTHHPDDRRGYRESAWNSRPLREEERGYAEEHHYQHDYRSTGDLYDPFEPSSSPPLETTSTLDKLASTLLELVARKTNENKCNL